MPFFGLFKENKPDAQIDAKPKKEIVTYRTEYGDGFIRVFERRSGEGFSYSESLSKYRLLGDTKVFISKAERTEKLNIPHIIVFAPTEEAAIEKFNKHRNQLGDRVGKLESIREATSIEKEYICGNALRFFYAI